MDELLTSIDQGAWALVAVAIVTSSASVIVAIVTGLFSIRQSRRTQESMEARIGTPNGQGNVVQMQEEGLARISGLERLVLRGQSEQDKRIARLEHADVDIERTLDQHDRRLGDHDRLIGDHAVRLGVLEATNQEGP